MSASGPGADMREAPINFCFRGYNRHANFRTSFQPLTHVRHRQPISTLTKLSDAVVIGCGALVAY
jgi:hypothetical protein